MGVIIGGGEKGMHLGQLANQAGMSNLTGERATMRCLFQPEAQTLTLHRVEGMMGVGRRVYDRRRLGCKLRTRSCARGTQEVEGSRRRNGGS